MRFGDSPLGKIKEYSLGYNDFDFFYKKEPPRPETDEKWDYTTRL
jgi:hypothetical protein